MFSITTNAHQILLSAIYKESRPGEKLYVRLTMGIG